MELIASLFCHVPEGLPETEVQQELQRQHDMLAQHAAHTGRAIEHCFFHVGEFLSLIHISRLGLQTADWWKSTCPPVRRFPPPHGLSYL